MNKLTVREWIFLIVIITLIQGVIWYISFVNSHNSGALNYVSFAGTLISIILAVLAIGYTYGESIGQKNQGNTLSNQISTLNEVIKNIEIEASALSKISDINQELIALSASFNRGITDTHLKVEDVKISLTKILSEYDKYPTKTEFIPNSIDKSTLSKLLLSARNPLLEISILGLYTQNNKKKDDIVTFIDESIVNYIKSAKKVAKDEKIDYPSNVSELFTGSLLSAFTFLKGAGLISEDDNLLILDDAFVKEIHHSIMDNPKDSGDFYKLIREEIKKNI